MMNNCRSQVNSRFHMEGRLSIDSRIMVVYESISDMSITFESPSNKVYV